MDHILETKGLRFAVSVEHDSGYGAPWDEYDCHGEVTAWTRRAKRPGERVLTEDRGSRRYYDVEGTLSRAIREGWGLRAADAAKLAAKLGRQPTKRELAAAAVSLDFIRLRDWCKGYWSWCVVSVVLLDDNGLPTWEEESLGGVASDAGDYLNEVALELADAIAARVGPRETITRSARVRAAGD